MGGIDVAVQEMDHDRLRAISRSSASAARSWLSSSDQDLAACVHALVDFQAQFTVDQWLEAAGDAVIARPGAAAELQHIAESRAW